MQLEKSINRPFLLSIFFYQESYTETAQSLVSPTRKEEDIFDVGIDDNEIYFG